MGLGDICGYYSQLEREFKSQGVPCVFVNAYPGIAYKRWHRPGAIGRVVEWLGEKRAKTERGTFRRKLWIALQGLSLLFLFLSTLPFYNVYIFSGGTTFLALHDLRLLRLLRKKIIVVFHGSDSRPPYLNAAVVGVNGAFAMASCINEINEIKNKIRTLERYADIIINHSMASHFHEARIINWLSIGIPYDCSIAAGYKKTAATGGPCVIVHAPTRPGPKGSVQIEKAINALKEKGYAIDFIKIVGRPNSEVLDAIAQCDFVVDELFSDTTMASFATEAAVFGKPAVVGMYGYDKLKEYTEAGMLPPSFVCHPDEIEAAIERLLSDRDYRIGLGISARQFIEQQWSARQVAKRFLKLTSGEIPREWWFDPKAIDYLHGWGLTEQRAREVVNRIIDSCGISALQLSDKPALEQAFAELAKDMQEPC